MPFAVERKNDLLYLTLDTPGTSVNIFNHSTSNQLTEIMQGVSKENTRAIIFRSAKPGSFANGVGMMLSHAVSSLEETLKESQPARDAYLAVRNSPVPTIAAIQGTCWGCGVEFVLNCQYRIAQNTYDTHFYMTEINEYFFIPLFRSTQNLPEAVGLSNAINMLLWGERWSAEKAAQHGLINQVVEPEDFERATEDFISKVLQNEVTPCLPGRYQGMYGIKEEAAVEMAKARIRILPPLHQDVYFNCLDLMVRAIRGEEFESHRKREIAYCAESTICDLGKSALSFFYIRQMAAGIALRKAPSQLSQTITVNSSSDLQEFYRDLRQRPLSGVQVLEKQEGASEKQDNVLSLVPYQKNEVLPNDSIAVSLQLMPFSSDQRVPVLYSPLYKGGYRLIEFAISEEHVAQITPIVPYLYRIGFQILVSQPKQSFAINRLLLAYIKPLLVYCQLGGKPKNVHHTLREFGFVKRIDSLLHVLEPNILISLLFPSSFEKNLVTGNAAIEQLSTSSYEGGEYDSNLIDALSLSLLQAVGTLLQEKCVRHPAQIDLIAREALDFPLRYKSLCTYLHPNRIRETQEKGSRLEPFLTNNEMVFAEEFLSSKKRFYR